MPDGRFMVPASTGEAHPYREELVDYVGVRVLLEARDEVSEAELAYLDDIELGHRVSDLLDAMYDPPRPFSRAERRAIVEIVRAGLEHRRIRSICAARH